MPPNPQPSPWICAPIPYCLEMCFPNQSWSRNGISASSDRNSVADAWGRGSAQNDDIKELCRKGGGSSHCLPNSLWLSLLDVQIQFVHFPNPPPTTSLWTPGKTKPPGLPHISPGFSALGEHLYWSLPTSLFFKEIHFSATLVKFFYTCSTPLPPPTRTHIECDVSLRGSQNALSLEYGTVQTLPSEVVSFCSVCKPCEGRKCVTPVIMSFKILSRPSRTLNVQESTELDWMTFCCLLVLEIRTFKEGIGNWGFGLSLQMLGSLLN